MIEILVDVYLMDDKTAFICVDYHGMNEARSASQRDRDQRDGGGLRKISREFALYPLYLVKAL